MLHKLDMESYGTWERQCMAEQLRPAILEHDYAESQEWRMQIFDSLFGLGVALRRDDT
jgi:hypothetical protein